MKKKTNQNSGQTATDYIVGQVSGSLFQTSTSPTASGSLSALFTSATTVKYLTYRPASKPVQRSSEVKEQTVVKVEGQTNLKQKAAAAKKKTAADRSVESRERALHTADEDEQQSTTIRKRKREAVREARGGAEEGEESPPKKRSTAEVDKDRDRRTVFVGNLPASCTKKTLLKIFRKQGTIETVRFRSVVREDPSMSLKVATIKRKVHPKKQSLNAYIVFKDKDGAVNALERNGMEIENQFFIRVDRVSEISHDNKRSIFVGNLAFDLNDLALRQHFEECGSVEGVRLIRDKMSGMGKGFGYVLFESADSVQLALKLDGSKLDGRAVRVRRSVKKEKKKSTGRVQTAGADKALSRTRNRNPGLGGPKGKPGSRGPKALSGKRPDRRPGNPGLGGPKGKPGSRGPKALSGKRPDRRPGNPGLGGPKGKPGSRGPKALSGKRPDRRPGNPGLGGPKGKPGSRGPKVLSGKRPDRRPGNPGLGGPKGKPGSRGPKVLSGKRPDRRPGKATTTSSSFKGEMAMPKNKKKGLKKIRSKKKAHI